MDVRQARDTKEAITEPEVSGAHREVVEEGAGGDPVVVNTPPPMLPPSNEHSSPIMHLQPDCDTESDSLVVKVRRRLPFWRSLSKSTFASRIIERGLTIPFSDKLRVKRLCKFNISPRKTSVKKRKVLRKEIKSLLAQGVIERAPLNVPLFENYIFSVKKPSGKIRIIFDISSRNYAYVS